MLEQLERVDWMTSHDVVTLGRPAMVLSAMGWRLCEPGGVVVRMVNFEDDVSIADAEAKLASIIRTGCEAAPTMPRGGKLYVRSPWAHEPGTGKTWGRYGAILFL